MNNTEEPKATEHLLPPSRGRSIPWLSVVQFHKEVVARAEQGFFSLNGGNDQDERWTSLRPFDPQDLAGSWRIDRDDIQSQPFRLALDQGQHDSFFLGGPCYLGWTKSRQGEWVPQWCPLLYREVELRPNDRQFEIMPRQGTWSITPLLYSLFARLEVNIGESPDELATRLIEKAAGYRRLEQCPLDRSILRALVSEVPDAEAELMKETRQGTFRVEPSPWVLFAPTSRFSALTQYLMRDYERLELLLAKDSQKIGGLRLLEDQPVSSTSAGAEVLPVIPLNVSQRLAVQRILEQRSLTVISGPPGTGKSQVVVALLLNAWARGQTVLFASNNNKAVDVVRERVERFESEFPIAVRAGARQKQNIQEVLRRTLNMANLATREAGTGVRPEKQRRQRQRLLEQRAKLQDALASRLPQRVDESRKTALRAYGEYRSTLVGIDEEERRYRAEQTELGFDGQPASRIEGVVTATRMWIDRANKFRDFVRQDDQRRSEIQAATVDNERYRDRAVEEIGLPASEVSDWKWLLTGPSPELLSDWERRIRGLLGKPVEQALESIEWREDFNRWRSAEQAEEWAAEARAFAETVLRACAELAPKLEDIRILSIAVNDGRAKLSLVDVPEGVELSVDVLRTWAASFAEYTTREQKRLDFLSWSQRSRLRRRLLRLERQLRPGLPLALWTQIGILNDRGRKQLGPILETVRRWIELRKEWEQAQDVIDEIENRFRDLRSQAAALRLKDVPTGQDVVTWTLVVTQCEESATIADQAASAWRRRAEKEDVEEQLRVIAKEWARLASGVPLREAWRRGQGTSFDEAMRMLADHPDLDAVAAARSALYTGKLARLIECWQSACDREQAASRLRMDLASVPKPSDRVKEWWTERPDDTFVLRDSIQSDWPDLEAASRSIDAVADWCSRWNMFIKTIKLKSQLKAREELEWAVSKLRQAVEVLPEETERSRVTEIYQNILKYPDRDWPVPDLNEAFAEFSPDRIRSRIERIEAELEKGSFEDAKTRWLERLHRDDEAIRAVDTLEKSLRQYKGQVMENHYATFRTALRAVPIWITTAQASQAIPLEPELFDIVVIDEASQCTLTNLLPLMYRGRTLAVIGDDNQLPAIPTIQESEELDLARKYGIEEYLALVGHATNDVYRTATETLPRRRADVVMLEEHFRSHPQIIGFSNRYIYLQQLELKKDPSWGRRLPVGSGMHLVSVVGVTQRGSNGRSWLNMPEAEAVLGLIQRLKEGDSRSLSLGVVTPFTAQKEILRERLDAVRLASEVLVDTAYGFQGDERDVIIFSPVVAKGITGSATRWVESPPNLINVAITRAREALFVVGDFDYCLQQEGILRKLALYCRDIKVLRETSEAELELFSWMVVKAWEPKVHPRIADIEVDFVLEGDSGVRLAIEVDG